MKPRRKADEALAKRLGFTLSLSGRCKTCTHAWFMVRGPTEFYLGCQCRPLAVSVQEQLLRTARI